MSDVLATLHRIRTLDERRALADRLDAEHKAETWETAVTELQGTLERAHHRWDGTAGMLQARHVYAVQVEPERRGRIAERDQARSLAGHAKSRFLDAAVARRSVERVLEIREEERLDTARKDDQREMDTIGAQRWTRRAA